MTAIHSPAAARRVTANPALFAATPTVYAIAWCTLKALRGQTVNRNRIGPPRHQIEPTGTHVLSFGARIRSHAATLGRSRPEPLILTDAATPPTHSPQAS